MTGRALLDGPELILADLRDAEGIARVVTSRRPDIIVHAAALKHLTMLQRHPGEAVKTNVWGTLSVLDACHDVEKFGCRSWPGRPRLRRAAPSRTRPPTLTAPAPRRVRPLRQLDDLSRPGRARQSRFCASGGA
jgi:hypothetical protein